ncbi:hypothetical protein SAMN00777080_4599 [Aquiflexum balticum DSM 16537]|uniref:Uncharacterized protein n=2 Tax=Aquiflexum TaxID=280472 RepID=A0A1W2HBE0_9BACT|nr:hypothetical protein SAMN00777080_4599 [Aquiflexum balticum DSM 16537]
MRIVFLILILIHALIHIMAFLKAFELAELKDFTSPVSKPIGLIWFTSFIILSAAAVFYFFNTPYWWVLGLIGAVLSQILIFQFWSEAKYGTIPNVLILLVAIIACFQFYLDKSIQKEITYIFDESVTQNRKIIRKDMIVDLPSPVQNWLENCGIVGKPAIGNVQMEQLFEIKLKPDQKNWYSTKAKQYITANPPSFIWTARMQVMPLVYASGRDKFIDGKGEMLFKLLSIFPVANDGNNPEINEAALQRFLGEIVWIPSAALEKYIKWEAIDNNSAKATLSYQGTSGSGIFTFNEKGEVEKYTAMRYMGSGPDAKRFEWYIDIAENKEMNGIIVPNKCSATWVLPSGEWTWTEIEVLKINFN